MIRDSLEGATVLMWMLGLRQRVSEVVVGVV